MTACILVPFQSRAITPRYRLIMRWYARCFADGPAAPWRNAGSAAVFMPASMRKIMSSRAVFSGDLEAANTRFTDAVVKAIHATTAG